MLQRAEPYALTAQVVAHRGASEDTPEHTLAAYKKAIADGAGALECDVRLTSDGVLVCVHDRTVDRTSDGRGVVSTLELADLAALDWGSWKGLAGNEQPDHDLTSVLTLERLLAHVADCGRRVELAIEAKHPTRYAGLVERKVVELLDRFGWAHPPVAGSGPVRVMSFSTRSVRRFSLQAPGLTTVLLLDALPMRWRDGRLPPGVTVAGPSIQLTRMHPGWVGRLHSRGYPVHVWTVNRAEDVELCTRLGVAAIITDRPRAVLDQLGR